MKISVKGKSLVVRVKELFTWTPKFVEIPVSECASEDDSEEENNEMNSVENHLVDSDLEGKDEEVAESMFEASKVRGENVLEKKTNDEKSADPFNIYEVLKMNTTKEVRKDDESLSHPPGFTQEVRETRFNSKSSSRVFQRSQGMHGQEILEVNSKVGTNGGSIIEVMDEMIRVGQTMGYSMEGCMKDIETIIGKQGGINGLK